MHPGSTLSNPNLRLRVIDWEVDSSGCNETGEVGSGLIKVHAPSVACILTTENQDSSPSYRLLPLEKELEDIVTTGSLMIDTPLEESEVINNASNSFTTLKRCSCDNKTSVTRDVLCLLVYHMRTEGDMRDEFVRKFLVLGIRTDDEDSYQRLGLLTLIDNGRFPVSGWFGEFLETNVSIS